MKKHIFTLFYLIFILNIFGCSSSSNTAGYVINVCDSHGVCSSSNKLYGIFLTGFDVLDESHIYYAAASDNWLQESRTLSLSMCSAVSQCKVINDNIPNMQYMQAWGSTQVKIKVLDESHIYITGQHFIGKNYEEYKTITSTILDVCDSNGNCKVLNESLPQVLSRMNIFPFDESHIFLYNKDNVFKCNELDSSCILVNNSESGMNGADELNYKSESSIYSSILTYNYDESWNIESRNYSMYECDLDDNCTLLSLESIESSIYSINFINRGLQLGLGDESMFISQNFGSWNYMNSYPVNFLGHYLPLISILDESNFYISNYDTAMSIQDWFLLNKRANIPLGVCNIVTRTCVSITNQMPVMNSSVVNLYALDESHIYTVGTFADNYMTAGFI